MLKQYTFVIFLFSLFVAVDIFSILTKMELF